MPINWGLMDTQYPQKLSELFNPNTIQQRQIAASDQNTMNQLRQAQLMQAAQGLQRAPELALREKTVYDQQQADYKVKQADALRKQKLIGMLNEDVPPNIRQQTLTQLYPEEAAKQAFKPIDAPKTREVQIGNNKVTQEWTGTNWKSVGTGPAWNPTQADNAPLSAVIKDGKPVMLPRSQAAGLPPASTKSAFSPTAQKELFEADDNIQAARNVQNILSEAAKINNTAYSGYGAKARATLRSNLPGTSQAADATVNLDNMMTGQALESLKLIFGGMPTEGERKILLDMQASADKTPQQRQDIINRAMQAAKRREQVSSSKAKALREGTYFSENPQDQNVEQSAGGAKFLGFE